MSLLVDLFMDLQDKELHVLASKNCFEVFLSVRIILANIEVERWKYTASTPVKIIFFEP